MLTYNHVFNTNLDYPYHVHILSSSSTVSINLNGVPIGYYKPTVGSKYSFIKYYEVPDILNLMIAGTRQTYDKKKEATYFKDSAVRYIKNGNDDFLCLDLETDMYYWSSTERTSFFFNPEYFNSSVLWETLIGYVPRGTSVVDLWKEEEAKTLFLNQIYETTQVWPGQKPLGDTLPINTDPYSNALAGESKIFSIDYFIEELQNLKNGDIIDLSNGVDSLSIVVNNCYTSAEYPLETVTTRPITYVNIDVINPNKRVVYAKDQEIGDQETISFTLYENDIQFSIKREAE